MLSDRKMREISSNPEDEEVIYSQIRPYQDEPLPEDAEENRRK